MLRFAAPKTVKRKVVKGVGGGDSGEEKNGEGRKQGF